MNPFRNRKPVLEPAAFYGRQDVLQALDQQLATQPPQCGAVVGLPRSGKTSLLYYLHQQARLPPTERQVPFGARQHVIAVYVNGGPYLNLGTLQLQGALSFWRDIASTLAQALPIAHDLLPPPDDTSSSDPMVLSQMYALHHNIAAAIRACPADMVLLLLDNAEGIARLPRVTGSLLRTLTQDPTLGARVAYVATSQVPLHQLYDVATWPEPSSFWSLFADTVYLGQLTPDAARALLNRPAANFRSEEQTMLLHQAGRHPDLLMLAGALLYDQRAAGTAPRSQPDWVRFEQQLFEAALPLCHVLWQSLAATNGAHHLLHRLAMGQPPDDDDGSAQAVLPLLTRLGVVEGDGNTWRLFSAVMQRFVRQQPTPPAERSVVAVDPLPTTPEPSPPVLPPAFTHLESAVYAFLAAHVGVVCDRVSIKQAVWPDNPPSDSALQKVIERIREKIEPDPHHPRYLLAVRGQGYILHQDDDL